MAVTFIAGPDVRVEFSVIDSWSTSVRVYGTGPMFDSTDEFLKLTGEPATDYGYYAYRVRGDVIIPDGVTSIASKFMIGEDLFQVIETVQIGRDVEIIGSEAFSSVQNNQLRNVISFSKVLHTIGQRAFYNRQSLVTCDFNESPRIIEDSAFQYCKNVTSLNLGPDLSLGRFVFGDCSSLVKFNKNNSLASLPDNVASGVFMNCINIDTFTITKACNFPGNAYFFPNFYVPLNKGSNCNDEGLQITKIYTSNPYYLTLDWQKYHNRFPIFIQGIEFLYIAHKGRWIKVQGYDSNGGSIPVAHESVYLWLKTRALDTIDISETPIFIKHGSIWLQLCY